MKTSWPFIAGLLAGFVIAFFILDGRDRERPPADVSDTVAVLTAEVNRWKTTADSAKVFSDSIRLIPKEPPRIVRIKDPGPILFDRLTLVAKLDSLDWYNLNWPPLRRAADAALEEIAALRRAHAIRDTTVDLFKGALRDTEKAWASERRKASRTKLVSAGLILLSFYAGSKLNLFR